MIELHHGDCLEIMKDIPDKTVDMILCDLPYGTTDCKWDCIIPFEDLWNQYNRVAKDNAAIVLFSAQPFTTKLIHSNIKNYRYNWYWKKNNKTGHTFAKYQPMRQIEDICVFYKKMPVYNPQGVIELENPKIRKKKACEDAVYKIDKKDSISITRFKNYPSNILEFKNKTDRSKRFHPTEKPVSLLEYLINTYTNPRRGCIG